VESGERLESAVEREVWEETGLRVQCGPLLGWAERLGPDHHFVILDFTVEVLSDPAEPVAGGDAAAVSWVPLADVPGLSLVEGIEVFLRAHGVLN
jgi:ADP-ribose pyrophosphatase YjhB (NUDIX family)